VYGLCRLCLDFKKEAYPYKLTKGWTKSLHIQLLMQHIEPEDNRIPVVECEDHDKLFETNIGERYVPRTAYEDFLQRRANARARELEHEGGEPGFDPIRFRKKAIRWWASTLCCQSQLTRRKAQQRTHPAGERFSG
jgi:hypothetical protein